MDLDGMMDVGISETIAVQPASHANAGASPFVNSSSLDTRPTCSTFAKHIEVEKNWSRDFC
jgi:hypothetical protein